eukprot:jgi/Mesen1/4733/ME000241S03777
MAAVMLSNLVVHCSQFSVTLPTSNLRTCNRVYFKETSRCIARQTLTKNSAYKSRSGENGSKAVEDLRQAIFGGGCCDVKLQPSNKWHCSGVSGDGSTEDSEEKFLSINDLLESAADQSDNFVFSDDGAEDDEANKDPFAPKDGQINQKMNKPMQVLPSASDMSKVLSSYQEAPPRIRDISVHQLREALESDSPPVLLDVRSPAEFAQGHAPTAVNVPLQDVLARVSDGSLQLSDRQVAVICQLGGRSARAALELTTALDLPDIINVTGGTSAWVEAGYGVE